MQEALEKKIILILDHLDGITDQRVLNLINVIGHKLEFKDIKERTRQINST